MRWSEDGSEVILSAEEFSRHTQSMTDMRQELSIHKAMRVQAEKILNESLRADVVAFRNAEMAKALQSRAEKSAKALREFENALRHIYPLLSNDYSSIRVQEVDQRMAAVRNVG